MKTSSKILLVGLGAALLVTLLSANLIVAADRTALDADYAKATADEVGLHAAIAADVREGISERAERGDDEIPLDRSEEDLLRAAVTEEYVRTQTEANIDRTYAYLHGEVAELRLEADTEPLKREMVAIAEADLDEIDLRELDVPHGDAIEEMVESESEFDRHRRAFREQQKQRIQAETDEELSDEELETRLDEGMGEIRERLHEEAQAELDGEFDGGRTPLEDAVRDLAAARVDALTGALTYDEYVDRVTAAKDEIGAAAVAAFEADLNEELPDTVDMTDGRGGQIEPLSVARTVVSTLGALAIALPIAAIAIVGGVAWLAPAPVAALVVGGVTTFVGAMGLAGSRFAAGRIETVLAGGDAPPWMAEFVVGFAVGVLGAVTWQSAALLIVGISLLGVGIGHAPIFRQRE